MKTESTFFVDIAYKEVCNITVPNPRDKLYWSLKVSSLTLIMFSLDRKGLKGSTNLYYFRSLRLERYHISKFQKLLTQICENNTQCWHIRLKFLFSLLDILFQAIIALNYKLWDQMIKLIKTTNNLKSSLISLCLLFNLARNNFNE